MFREIARCRICGNTELVPVLDLGHQALTGLFPKSASQDVERMPLELVKCQGDAHCGLLQLRHTGDLARMYGEKYGYRSGLNRSMVQHLRGKVRRILDRVPASAGDLVIDIGSNDGTTLRAYPNELALVGIDPTGEKFRSYYPSHVELIPDFFSAAAVRDRYGARKARIVTSFSMFYDLEDPTSFMREVHEILADDGIWVLEQSYMPTMLERNSYDTVCHEHLEYYGLRQIQWMAQEAGFRILDVEFNDVNGGSFSVTVAKVRSPLASNEAIVTSTLSREDDLGLPTLAPYRAFEERVSEHRRQLIGLLHEINSSGKRVFGYGASTKGNVILQYCNLTDRDLTCIAEVNEDKFGAFTPGSLIPIVPEAEARRMKPDFFLVLPWHFRDAILSREAEFLRAGGRLVFPMPSVTVV